MGKFTCDSCPTICNNYQDAAQHVQLEPGHVMVAETADASITVSLGD